MTEILWVVQEDLLVENRRHELVRVLDQMSIPYECVQVSGYETTPEITHDGPIVTNGSIMLSKIANQRGWTPGSEFNDNFSYRVWFERLRPYLLNKDAVFASLADRPHLDEFFIRPISDEKTFTGRVMRLDEYDGWRADLPATTQILYASIKRTGQEHRHFIIDGQVVTSSRYKLNQQPNFTHQVDEFIVDFANKITALWAPSRMFVLDTYVVGDEIGVVELGCLAHAGFYEADVQKIVHRINSMIPQKPKPSSWVLPSRPQKRPTRPTHTSKLP